MTRDRILQLDGLRAIAVILVVFHHLNVYTTAIPGFNLLIENGGRFGVILFFILSGYLMSMFYLGKTGDEKTLSYGSFYFSRFIRIVPLYVISTSLFYLLRSHIDVFVAQNQTIDFRDFLLGLIFLNKQPMFLNPVIWTLKIEIIFYIIFPLIGHYLHYFFAQKKPLYLFAMPLCLLLFSTAIRQYQSLEEDSFFTNLDGLAAGILACVVITLYRERNMNLNNLVHYFIISISGLFLALALNFVNSPVIFPTIASFMLGMLFISTVLLERTSWLVKILSNPIFFHIALLSYSIYIWHFNVYYNISKPFINSLEISTYHKSIVSSLLAIFLTVILAFITYHFIEKPFIRLKSRKQLG